MNPNLPKYKTSTLLKEARLISILKILQRENNLLAIYLVRLIFGFKLVTAKKYLARIDKFLAKSPNAPYQYYRPNIVLLKEFD